jgi:hypothetical protein
VDEIAVRVAVVVGLFAVALAAGRWWRPAPAVGRVKMEKLGPGVIVFTSEACSACGPVIAVLDRRLGEGEYRRIRWEDDPEVFARHRIERVPAVAVLDAAGRGRLWEGVPPARLLRRTVDP